jgi:predicted dehydrogenase
MNSNKDKIGVGVVGIGNWGRYGHVPVLQLLPNFEIVAVANRRKSRFERTLPNPGALVLPSTP